MIELEDLQTLRLLLVLATGLVMLVALISMFDDQLNQEHQNEKDDE